MRVRRMRGVHLTRRPHRPGQCGRYEARSRLRRLRSTGTPIPDEHASVVRHGSWHRTRFCRKERHAGTDGEAVSQAGTVEPFLPRIVAREASVNSASKRPRFRRLMPDILVDLTSAITVASSPGASCEIIFSNCSGLRKFPEREIADQVLRPVSSPLDCSIAARTGPTPLR